MRLCKGKSKQKKILLFLGTFTLLENVIMYLGIKALCKCIQAEKQNVK